MNIGREIRGIKNRMDAFEQKAKTGQISLEERY